MVSRALGVFVAFALLPIAAMAQPDRTGAPGVPFGAGAAGPDCNGDGLCDALDYLCFQSAFAVGDAAADCDGSGVLDVFDLLCFNNAMIDQRDAGVDEPRPGQVCTAFERYIAKVEANGGNPLAALCALDGPCDDAAARDSAIPTIDTPIKTYRLNIQVFCNNDGSACAATPSQVAAAVARLNADYLPWRIQFEYGFRFVNNSKYRFLAANEEFGMKRSYAQSTATQLNVYVVDTGGGNWGTFPWDLDSLRDQGGIVMHVGAFNSGGYIFTHEVGHCLGLWHTHHGVNEVPPCSDCYEPAGRTAEVGDNTGDRCSDTNPTPRNDGNCFDAAGNDACSGLPWAPTPYNNFMSYSYGNCPDEFTPQQGGRMHCWTEDRLTGWMVLPAPPAAPGTPSLTKIGGGVVRIDWADNSGDEDGFRVQRETKSGPNWINAQIVATVGADVSTTTNSPGAGTFRYRVQAFNGLGDSAWSGWAQVKN